MQIYNNFKVVGIDKATGQVDVVWFDDTRDANNQRVTPIAQQHVLLLSHKVPMESETEGWTREQVRQFWVTQVQDVYDIPQWADDEVGTFVIDHNVRVRRGKDIVAE